MKVFSGLKRLRLVVRRIPMRKYRDLKSSHSARTTGFTDVSILHNALFEAHYDVVASKKLGHARAEGLQLTDKNIFNENNLWETFLWSENARKKWSSTPIQIACFDASHRNKIRTLIHCLLPYQRETPYRVGALSSLISNDTRKVRCVRRASEAGWAFRRQVSLSRSNNRCMEMEMVVRDEN